MILFLGSEDSPLLPFLRLTGEAVMWTQEPLTVDIIHRCGDPFLVSFNYHHIVTADVLEDVGERRAVNLHIAYLPFNRGADPNFWSWVDDTPKGVTLHYMDEGIDTGPVILRWDIADHMFPMDSTLRTTYDVLQRVAVRMFRECWSDVRAGSVVEFEVFGGTYHNRRDRESLEYLLTDGWDTPVSVLAEYGRGR